MVAPDNKALIFLLRFICNLNAAGMVVCMSVFLVRFLTWDKYAATKIFMLWYPLAFSFIFLYSIPRTYKGEYIQVWAGKDKLLRLIFPNEDNFINTRLVWGMQALNPLVWLVFIYTKSPLLTFIAYVVITIIEEINFSEICKGKNFVWVRIDYDAA